MSFVTDVQEASHRFSTYVEEFRSLLIEYGVQGEGWLSKLRRANRDSGFRAKRDTIWKELLEQEGGKLSLGTVMAIIGAVLGGIGVAGFGGAIGIPLTLLLAPVGVIFGHELDQHGVTKSVIRKVRSWFMPDKENMSSGVQVDHPASDGESTSKAQTEGVDDDELAAILELMTQLNQRFEADISMLRENLNELSEGLHNASVAWTDDEKRLSSLEASLSSFPSVLERLASVQKVLSTLEPDLSSLRTDTANGIREVNGAVASVKERVNKAEDLLSTNASVLQRLASKQSRLRKLFLANTAVVTGMILLVIWLLARGAR